jgi:Predicted metal-binding integral membrane protein (DUF2182)
MSGGDTVQTRTPPMQRSSSLAISLSRPPQASWAMRLLEAGRSLAGGLFAWDRAGRFTAAGVLVAAALYQLTPSKNACLSRCRSRRAFLLQGWRDGRDRTLRIGMEHGAWCMDRLAPAAFRAGVRSAKEGCEPMTEAGPAQRDLLLDGGEALRRGSSSASTPSTATSRTSSSSSPAPREPPPSSARRRRARSDQP